MNLSEYYDISALPPFLLSAREIVEGESNASVISKIAWKYRVKPGFVTKFVFQNSRSMSEAMSRDVAVSGNSVTKKSLMVDRRLAEVTGIVGFCGSYSYLAPVLDKSAKGLISDEKKWCSRCYAESMSIVRPERWSRVSDQLYWSLNMATHCAKHFCSLSNCCGRCFSKQPYISSSVEPGFCHSCYWSLAEAPSISIECDDERAQLQKKDLRYDIFITRNMPDTRELSKARLAQNLRAIIEFSGLNGASRVAQRCGVSEHTLKDWSRGRHGLSFESLVGVIDGLGLPRATDLFAPTEEFCSLVKTRFTGRMAMHVRQDRSSALPMIEAYLKKIMQGKVKSKSRAEIAKKFGVSVGMLEHSFREELEAVSQLYKRQKSAKSTKSNDRLYFEMRAAVRRCGAKNRSFDWQNIAAELRNVDLMHVKQSELIAARAKAIDAYRTSPRRKQDRDVESLVVDD